MPEAERPSSALHGRRKGKKLRSFQAGLVEDLLPRLALDLTSDIADPATLFPHKLRQIWLEIGFGGGEHVIHQARSNPDVGILACEPFMNGAAKLLAAISQEGFGNIRLHAGDAADLLRRLPADCLERIYLLYPDPWPKRRQRKRRFISDEMLQKLARVLRPGGELRYATDIDGYAGWTLARVLRSTCFAWHPQASHDWLEPWPDWPGTRYEAKALAAGRPRGYYTFRRL